MDKEDVQNQDGSPEDLLEEENMNQSNAFSAAFKTLQRIALYETKSRFYVVGSNNTQSKFRILKIDRMDPRKLNISDDSRQHCLHLQGLMEATDSKLDKEWSDQNCVCFWNSR